MIKSLNGYMKNIWWSPIMTTTVIGATFFFVLPSIALIGLNSRNTMLAIIATGCFCFPWMIARLHHTGPFISAAAFYAVVIVGWMLKPSAFDGNPKLALASYLIPWLIIALLAVAIVSAVLMRRRMSI